MHDFRSGALRPIGRRAFIAAFAFAAAFGAWLAVRSALAQTALVITSGPSVSSVAQDSAVIRWSTAEPSTTVVRYGTTAAMGSSQRKVVIVPGAPEEDAYELSHSLTLAELAPATTYFYEAESAASDGRMATSAQSTFTTAAAAQPLAGVAMTGPASGAEVASPVALSATTSGPAATVDFTIDDAAGAKVTKVGAAADSGNDQHWLFGNMSLPAGSYAVFATATGVDAAGVPVTFTSGPVPFTVSPACTADTWSCGAWGSCDPAKKTQARTCTLKADCPGVSTPKPAESQSCTPACTADTWECRWGRCANFPDEEGWLVKQECRMTFDCPGVATPEPAAAKKPCCVDAPDGDVWTCTDWGECGKDGTRRRECRLTSDCPELDVPMPPSVEKCEPGSVTAATDTNSSIAVNAPLSAAGSSDVNAPSVASAGSDVNAPAFAGPASAESVIAALGGADQAKTLADECVKAGIMPDRCAAWLKSKYGDPSCAEAGVFTYAACEKRLTDANGGTFPGCEGKTPDACGLVKAKALLGYMPDDTKKKVDDAVGSPTPGDAIAVLGPSAGLLLAVNPAKQGDSVWWPAVTAEGGETSSNMIVFDADKDGLLDDLEARLGTDPRVPDLEKGGAVDGKAARDALKLFFADGEIPSQEFVFVDTDGDGRPDLVEDRNLLGLKKYDPAKVYQAGDTIAFEDGRKVNRLPDGFFEKGDKPTEPQLGVDLDKDGKADVTMSVSLLRKFFETGDKPTQDRFGIVDRALMTGAPLEQPLTAGATDPGLTIGLSSPPEGRSGSGGQGEDVNQPGILNDSAPLGGGTRDVNQPDSVGAAGRPAGKGAMILKGKAAPHAVVVLYVYSYVPMVLTTTADEDGNYTYDLSDNVVDGEHTAYVALTDDTGKIAKKSAPLSFFVKEAQAVTKDDFQRPDVVVNEPVVQAQRTYLLAGGLAIVVGLAVVLLVVVRKMKEAPTEPPAPPAA